MPLAASVRRLKWKRLPTLLLIAWLLPLASFTVICIGYSMPQMLGVRVRYSTQKYAGYIAIGAIVGGFLLSIDSLCSASGCRRIRSRPPRTSRRKQHADTSDARASD